MGYSSIFRNFTVPYQATVNSRSGRDYASYHYAVKATHNNDSPYTVEDLNQLAKEEGTRKSVHPFFYPPPAILSVLGTTIDAQTRCYKPSFGSTNFVFLPLYSFSIDGEKYLGVLFLLHHCCFYWSLIR